MSKALKIYFISSVFLGGLIYTSQKLSIPTTAFINNYLNDFLIIPIVLTVCLLILKKTKNNKDYQISLPIILYVCGLYSILFEWYFPQILTRYTSDFLDVLLYFISGLIFYRLQKR